MALAAVRMANVPYLADSRSMSLEILRARRLLENEFSIGSVSPPITCGRLELLPNWLAFYAVWAVTDSPHGSSAIGRGALYAAKQSLLTLSELSFTIREALCQLRTTHAP